MKNNEIKFNVPFYTAYLQPQGYFDKSREVHALWNYYTMARLAYERHILDPIVLEGDKDGEANFQQIFTSVARMYRVEPEAMGKCWDMVDSQCDLMELPRMPDEDRYRFITRIIVVQSVKLN